jgi:hypothetical protein
VEDRGVPFDVAQDLQRDLAIGFAAQLEVSASTRACNRQQ